MIVVINCLIDSGRYIKVVYFTPVSIVHVLLLGRRSMSKQNYFKEF